MAAIAGGGGELAAGLGYRFGAWPLGTGFQIMRWSASVALAASAAALIATLLALAYAPRRTLVLSVIALAIGLSIAAPPVYYFWQAKHVPPIHDISTDTVNPPRFVAVLPLRKDARNPVDYSPAVAAQQKAAYPDIAPALLSVPPTRALQLAEQVARSMGWDIVAVSPADLRIEATATTLLFGFKDDIVIRVTPEDGASRVDIRSLSRVGVSDLGTNARRVRAFLSELKAAAARS